MKPKNMKNINDVKAAVIKGVLNKSQVNVLINKMRVQVSHYRMPVAKRVSILYHRRRAEGKCTQCGKKVTKKNTRTKKLYRLCEKHRKLIDKKERVR